MNIMEYAINNYNSSNTIFAKKKKEKKKEMQFYNQN